MGNYLFRFSDGTFKAIQDAFGKEAWEKLGKYSEAELKTGLPTIGGFIQKRIKDGKMPTVVWGLIDPKKQPAEMAAKNLFRMARLQPCMIRVDGDGHLFEGPDGTVVLGFQVGPYWLLSSVFREAPNFPPDLKAKAPSVPGFDADVWAVPADAASPPVHAAPVVAAGPARPAPPPAPRRGGFNPSQGAGGGSIEDLFEQVEARLQSGEQLVTKPEDELFHFTIYMTDDFVERYGIGAVVRQRGAQVQGKSFSVIFDKDIPNFFRDETMAEDLGGGVTMDIATIYGSTDIAFRKDGRDLFQLTKITRVDLGHPSYLDLKPANPAYTKKVAEADLCYVLNLKK